MINGRFSTVSSQFFTKLSIAYWYYFFIDKMIVNWSTIDDTLKENFDTLVYNTFNQTYDWQSISHYTNKEFRKKNTLGFTLISKVSHFWWNNSKTFSTLPILMQNYFQKPDFFKTTEIGRGPWMSVKDVQKLKTMYGCPGRMSNFFNPKDSTEGFFLMPLLGLGKSRIIEINSPKLV